MRIKGAAGKWVSGGLGVVCLLLLMNLLRGGVPTAGEKEISPLGHTPDARHIQGAHLDAKDELSRYNPEVKLDLLSDIQQQELPNFARNPFEFPPPKEAYKVQGPPWVPPGSRDTSSPPPTLPIKLIGYSEKVGGMKEGIVSDEDGIYVVHEGETFNKRYKVNKLTTTMASIYDEVTHQTVEMPIAQ